MTRFPAAIALTPLWLALGASASEAGEMEGLFHMVSAEIDFGGSEEGGRLSWDAEAWIGGDVNKAVVAAEGEAFDGETEASELYGLYRRQVSTYFDAAAGIRYDFEPDGLAHLALGVAGLAPYHVETVAFAFLSEEGDVSARLELALAVPITQRLIAAPHLEINAFAQDVAELDVGAGLSDLELGLQIRYEIKRKFAPYVDFLWQHELGETAAIASTAGVETSNLILAAGIAFWF